MTEEEILRRLAEDDADRKKLWETVLGHIREEDEWRPRLDAKVNEIHNVLISVRGTAKFFGWMVAGIVAMATAWDWMVSHFHISPK